MKITKLTAAILTAFIIIALALSVSANNELHWYFKKNDTHTQPPIPSEFAFIENYGGYYIDHAHDDANAEKVIYLTFDAGYENGNVAKVLDALKKHNATGTFFVLENLITRNTDLIKRMFDEGHTVANHTMKHKNMSQITDRAVFEAELYGLEQLCLDMTGHKMARLYRPPEGSFSEDNMKIVNDMGFKTVFWSFAYADWDNNKQPSTDAALSKLLAHVHNGEILLLHPTSATNAAILDEFLTRLEQEGYRFGSLEELCDV
ncbi:MAG: polysaccharide deacetylase family protein [Clostridiales bacterium]|nr:polysaccharide deacetylase family protein [Clostridiales bacterium]